MRSEAFAAYLIIGAVTAAVGVLTNLVFHQRRPRLAIIFVSIGALIVVGAVVQAWLGGAKDDPAAPDASFSRSGSSRAPDATPSRTVKQHVP